MIPKIIHYCWFGGKPIPTLARKCIESWKKYCPDFEIKEWNESNFDMNYNSYVKQACIAQKWAFVSDVVRLYAITTFGGIYMDTDVELIKPIDKYLELDGFSGFESTGMIPTGLMAASQGQSLFEELLHDYDDATFTNADGSSDLTTNVQRITHACKKYGLLLNNATQTINGVTFYSSDYLCPKDCVTRELHITQNTVCIHHFDGSWMPANERRKTRIRQLLGEKNSSRIRELFEWIWRRK